MVNENTSDTQFQSITTFQSNGAASISCWMSSFAGATNGSAVEVGGGGPSSWESFGCAVVGGGRARGAAKVVGCAWTRNDWLMAWLEPRCCCALLTVAAVHCLRSENFWSAPLPLFPFVALRFCVTCKVV
jgi:hypothetical protein